MGAFRQFIRNYGFVLQFIFLHVGHVGNHFRNDLESSKIVFDNFKTKMINLQSSGPFGNYQEIRSLV